MDTEDPGAQPPTQPQVTPDPDPVQIGRSAARSEATPPARSSGGASLGAVLILIGSLLILAGTVTPWLSVTLHTDALQDLGASFEGIPTSGGLTALQDSLFSQAAMALGVVMLLCGIIGLAGPRTRRGVGIVVILASVGVAGLAAASILTAESRSRDSVGADFDAQVENIDVPEELQATVDEVRATTIESFEVAPGMGVWLAFGGAALGLVGGMMCVGSRKE